MPTTYFAYTRVSTTQQSIEGSSLVEQRRNITQYATKHHLQITKWFEEVESASKGRRVVFKNIVRLLKHRKTTGLIIHKMDRGVRSIRDWADLGDLIDSGVDIRFAHDNLDLSTRSGRLTADIQAVMATDYIRNLREEVKKGIQGRLHQGIYPFRAPRGYLDQGRGRVKRPDPIMAPLVVEAFRQYATGLYTLQALSDKLAILGLLNPSGDSLTPSTLSNLLRCKFYIGKYQVRGIIYQGRHQPLVSSELFDRVQRLLQRRGKHRRIRHHFKYSRRLQCKSCQKSLVGEEQKARVYYRCHNCAGVCVREDRVKDHPNPDYSVTTSIESKLQPYSEFDSP